MSKSLGSLRRDLLLGAAILIVLYLIFRQHDNAGNTTPTPSTVPTHVTTS